jgi:hypothetical protein
MKDRGSADPGIQRRGPPFTSPTVARFRGNVGPIAAPLRARISRTPHLQRRREGGAARRPGEA